MDSWHLPDKMSWILPPAQGEDPSSIFHLFVKENLIL